MMLQTLDELLDQAQAAADQQDWEAAFASLNQAKELDPDHVGALTGLGTCLLQLGRPVEAVPYFQDVADKAPESPEAHNNLGVVYAVSGELEAAETAYQAAVELDPDHAPAWKNLAVIYLRQDRLVEGVQILAAVVQAHPEDLEAMTLLAGCYEAGEEYASARVLYEEVIKRQPDHVEAQQALKRLPAAVPDPSRIARPEHASKLAALKGLKRAKGSGGKPENGSAKCSLRVAFYGPPEAATEFRLGLPVEALAGDGASVKVGSHFDPDDLEDRQAAVFANPHLSPELSSAVDTCKQAGLRVVVDVDRDFHHYPPSYPGYERFGPGNPQKIKDLERILGLADAVSVPSPALAERYRAYARELAVIPYGWNRSNEFWDQPAPVHGTFKIGLVGTHTYPKDLAVLKHDLVRVMEAVPSALLVAGADPALYEAFNMLPGHQRMFLPVGRIEEYPFLLSNFDLLLVPLQKNSFNLARSDLALLEAGVRRIPWVASPVPAFREWGTGGLFAEKRGEWYAAMMQLAEDEERRAGLAAAGRAKAEAREGAALLTLWREVLV